MIRPMEPGRHPIKITAPMLRDIDLFKDVDETLLTALVEELVVRQAATGEMVMREKDPAGAMFLVIAGELEVLKHGQSGNEVRVAMFGPGDWFGEMAILDVQPRSASVRAVAPTILLHVGPDDMEKLLERDLRAYAMIMRNIARELSRRLRVADGILAHLVARVTDEYVRPSRK